MHAGAECIITIGLFSDNRIQGITDIINKNFEEVINKVGAKSMKKKSKNKISVVIPVYNAKIYISDAIESVLGQTYMNWELIIVDNMSKDDSLKICRAYEKKYENVHVYEEKKKAEEDKQKALEEEKKKMQA